MVVTPIMTTMITATSSAANKFHAWHPRNLNTRGELQVNSFIYSKTNKYNEMVSVKLSPESEDYLNVLTCFRINK